MTSLKHPPAPSCLRRADAAGAQVGLRLRTCKKPRACRHPRAAGSARDTTWQCERVSREVVCGCALPLLSETNAGRGARCADSGSRAQIAVGVRGPRADASESTPCAVRAAPCLSLHVIRSPTGSLSAWRRRAMQPGGVSANDTRAHLRRGGVLRGGAGPCSPAASQRTILEALSDPEQLHLEH